MSIVLWFVKFAFVAAIWAAFGGIAAVPAVLAAFLIRDRETRTESVLKTAARGLFVLAGLYAVYTAWGGVPMGVLGIAYVIAYLIHTR